jgi:excisionase family DNA binding protein
MKAIIQSITHRTMNTSALDSPIISQSSDSPTLIKKKELAKLLSVSPRTIDAWVQRREIPCIKVTARLYLYEIEAVMAAIRKKYGTNVA